MTNNIRNQVNKYFQSGFISVLMISAVCLFSMAVSSSLHADALDRAAISELYNEARDLFRQADTAAGTSYDHAMTLYKKAAMRYERIIKEGGIENGKIYYNLGNIYFRMNDIGRAILNYRKAEQYMPDDNNLKQNLTYARAKRIDRIEEKQETKVMKTLFFWHYDLSVKSRLMLFTLFFAIFWVSACVRIFFKKPFLFWLITSSALVSILFCGSLAADEYLLKKQRPGVILTTETTARKGNSETYEPSFMEPLHAGTEFTLIEARGEWFQIELADSRTCWVQAKDVELVR
ncbi:MAG: tetratricopeptide repeat protein [Desulfatiglans sp.]|jgi:tetratricopeptide (TPR) repeat protein|nr:tetratricopeptide repeat protein [Desulfatiglans sp.]